MMFCDRPIVTMKEKDSGKQISVEFQTIAYEYFKNNCVELLSHAGSVKAKDKPVEGKDLKDAQIDIQYFPDIKTIYDVQYSITFNLCHTSKSMFIQNHWLWLRQQFLTEGWKIPSQRLA